MNNYVKEMVDKGYKSESAEPLKCHNCESSDLRDIDDYEEGYVCHTTRICVSCDTVCGEWDYGSWGW